MSEKMLPPRKLLLPRRPRPGASGVQEHLTDGQRALLDSPYRITVAWGGNGIGKSVGLAQLVTEALRGGLYWQAPGRPYTVILAGNTWTQLGSTIQALMSGPAQDWFRAGVRYEAGGMKGQRLQVYEVVRGPGVGGELRCGTFRAANLAGPRADVVATDEPLPQDVHNELWPRLLGRGGRLYETFTTTLGTYEQMDYLWDLVDDPSVPFAGEVQTELTTDAVTPRGGLVEVPWISQAEIDQLCLGLSAIEVDMRMGRTRYPRLDTAYFSAWGPHLITMDGPPAGIRLGIGIDHGSKPGAERAVLAAVGGRGLKARAWIIDEYYCDSRTTSELDAAGVVAMLERSGYTISDVDLWVGDRAHGGDRLGGKKSNDRFKAAIAEHFGLRTDKLGWSQKLPRPLRTMQTPRKYDRSVWEGCEILHRMMVGSRLTLHPRCGHLASDLSVWQGSRTDPAKDGIDALRYIVVPMATGVVR